MRKAKGNKEGWKSNFEPYRGMGKNDHISDPLMARSTQTVEITHKQYLEALHTVRLYSRQIALLQTEVEMDLDSISRFLSVTEETHLVDLPLTRRTLNVLLRMEGLEGSQYTLKDLENVSLAELAKQKNAGQRTLFEIEELCLYTGIKFLP